jgi:prefoldin alpha subunit
MVKDVKVPDGKEKTSQEELQEKLFLFQILEKHLETLKQQGTLIETRLVEIETTRAAIDEINKLKDDNETLVPLGSGLYVKGRIIHKEILTELGASVMLKKSLTEVIDFLDDKRKELEKVAKQIEEQANEVIGKMNDIGPEIQRMAAQVRK